MTYSVYNKIQAGEYKSKLEYPKRPVDPNIFSKKIIDLTPQQIADFAAIKEKYDADMQVYRTSRDAYHADQQILNAAFRIDLETENGMIGHPKADLLFSKAWEMGHSSGLSEVYSHYVDLLELVE